MIRRCWELGAGVVQRSGHLLAGAVDLRLRLATYASGQLGLLAAAGLFVYQQWLIRDRDRAACFRAFLNNHYFGMSVFAGLFADYLSSDL